MENVIVRELLTDSENFINPDEILTDFGLENNYRDISLSFYHTVMSQTTKFLSLSNKVSNLTGCVLEDFKNNVCVSHAFVCLFTRSQYL